MSQALGTAVYMNSFIYSFDAYLLNTYHALDTVFRIWNNKLILSNADYVSGIFLEKLFLFSPGFIEV